MNKTIIITQGDPNGIGPEIILKTIKNYKKYIIIGSKNTLNFYSKLLSIPCNINIIKNINNISLSQNKLNLFELEYNEKIIPGKLSKKAGAVSLEYINTAFLIINKTNIKTLITMPVNKEAIMLNHKNFTGHTEYLKELAKIKKTTMIMASKNINVALVTTHLPLKQIAQNITTENIINTIKHAKDFLKYTKQENKTIAICALNPHSGEGGKLGKEEKEIILPAIIKAKKMNINTEGPLAADSAFSKQYPIYIAMYHDQGLIPFKLLSFQKGVNITIGLPFNRISVDHGTAFNIAGKNKANNQSLKEAIKWAEKLIKYKKN